MESTLTEVMGLNEEKLSDKMDFGMEDRQT